MGIKNNEELLSFIRMMLSRLNLGDSIVKQVEHPEGLELPSICIDETFSLWLGDGGKWFADVAYTTYRRDSGADTSITELYIGPSYMDAFAEIFNGICKIRFERARESWAMDREAKEYEGPSST